MIHDTRMRATTLHILGAGSIGLLLGAYFSLGGQPVCMLRRPGRAYPPRLSLTLEGDESRQSLELEQRAAGSPGPAIKRLILCTKAYDALPGVQTLSGRLAEGAQLLLMQNGMGSQQAIARAFPALNIAAASSTEGAFRPAADTVVHAGRGITRIGYLQGAGVDWAALFRAAGLAAEAVSPIEWHLANKLRVNALINPLTALHDCRNGELLSDPRLRAHMQALGAEVDAVLSAAGFSFSEPALAVAEQVAAGTAANVSSMCQDARAGRPLELEYITGYLLQLGERCGVPTPLQRELYQRMTVKKL